MIGDGKGRRRDSYCGKVNPLIGLRLQPIMPWIRASCTVFGPEFWILASNSGKMAPAEAARAISGSEILS